jgi:hypothetical protein
MDKLREIHLYVGGILLYLIARLYLGSLFGVGGVIGFLLFILGLRWGVNPFILRKDMPLPRFSNTILVKGKDDSVRFLLFMVCLFLCYASVFGPIN